MRELPPGWASDLAILRLTGSTVEDRGDHLAIRTPQNPDFHWGNFLFVTEENTVGDAARWVEAFHASFPAAWWVAIGLIRMPDDATGWAAQGIDLELDDVLSTRTMPRLTPLAQGYTARQLGGDDWEQSVQRDLEENERTGEHAPRVHERFVRARIETRRSLCDRDLAAFFGAFADGVLVAELGIVRCEGIARYQSVATTPAHRRHGLASHLLGAAAQWAAARGCQKWLIFTEATNPAGRLYRSLGFAPDSGNAQAYRGTPAAPVTP